MKNIRILIAVCLLLLSSCGDFLEEESRDLIIPKSIQDYKEFFYGEVIVKNPRKDIFRYLTYMTDDVSTTYIPTSYTDYRNMFYGYYTWADEYEYGFDKSFNEIDTWKELYHYILTCNIIIDNVQKINVKADEEIAKNTLLAECHFFRAYSYFHLVNIYGEPYKDEQQADKALGVPIVKAVSVEPNLHKRSSLKNVYNLVEQDLNLSINYYKNGIPDESVFRPNLSAAYLLSSRVALFKKQYEKCEDFCDKVIANTSAVVADINTFEDIEKNSTYYFSEANKGIIFSYGARQVAYWGNDYNSGFCVSQEHIDLYEQNDLRGKLFFHYDNKPSKSDYYQKYYQNNMRIEEAYVNRAESRVYQDNLTGALNDINYLRSFKFEKDYELSSDNKKQVIEYIRKERRIEFCFEFFRWYDLRRYGCPRIEHKMIIDGQENIFVLEEDDSHYTLALPKEIRDNNHDIQKIR